MNNIKDLQVLALGVASALCYTSIYLLIDNAWATAGISLVLALATVAFAIRNYRINPQMTPYSVIGLAAATVTAVYITNFLIAQAVVNASTNSY
jgi:hypothetical protein